MAAYCRRCITSVLCIALMLPQHVLCDLMCFLFLDTLSNSLYESNAALTAAELRNKLRVSELERLRGRTRLAALKEKINAHEGGSICMVMGVTVAWCDIYQHHNDISYTHITIT